MVPLSLSLYISLYLSLSLSHSLSLPLSLSLSLPLSLSSSLSLSFSPYLSLSHYACCLPLSFAVAPLFFCSSIVLGKNSCYDDDDEGMRGRLGLCLCCYSCPAVKTPAACMLIAQFLPIEV
jgi:hypothetical protein